MVSKVRKQLADFGAIDSFNSSWAHWVLFFLRLHVSFGHVAAESIFVPRV